MDSVRAAIYVGAFALIVTLATAGVVAWANLGSRNLALAVGALVAAAFLFIIQVAFELQGSALSDHVSFEFTTDRLKPEIRQWNYTNTPTWRIGLETNASAWLLKNNPEAFATDRNRLTMDFALYSLASFLVYQEFDWQLRKLEYKTVASGTSWNIRGISKPKECTLVKIADFHKELVWRR